MEERIRLAFELFDEGDVAGSIQAFKAIESEITEQDEYYDYFLLSYGYALSANDEMNQARKIYQTLLDRAKTPDDEFVAYHQLGMLERMDGEYEAALNYFKQERQVLEQHFSDDPMVNAVNLYEVGYTTMLSGQYDQAKEYLQESLKLSLQSEDDMTIGCSYRALGELEAVNENMTESKDYFTKAKSHFKTVGEFNGIEEIEMLESVIFSEN